MITPTLQLIHRVGTRRPKTSRSASAITALNSLLTAATAPPAASGSAINAANRNADRPNDESSRPAAAKLEEKSQPRPHHRHDEPATEPGRIAVSGAHACNERGTDRSSSGNGTFSLGTAGRADVASPCHGSDSMGGARIGVRTPNPHWVETRDREVADLRFCF